MIPEKLYIPTSTLNFNNLMSSEAISPAAFYYKRGFGYKRFEKVGPNNLDNRIILYKEVPVFKIEDKELENYPLVIEVDVRHLKEDIIKEKNGVYFSEETIYLNPFSTRFIFRNDLERVSTISKAEPGIETKMVPLYKNTFLVMEKKGEIKSFKWERTEIEDSENDISPYISKDRKINKLKGLLFAYLIASNKYISSDAVVLKKIVRNLKNTLSAIITSPDGLATYSQEEQLKSLYKSMNNRLLNVFIAPVIKEKSEKYGCDFYSVLLQENLWDSWLRQNDYLKFQVAPFHFPIKDKDNGLRNYIHYIENQISSLEYLQKRTQAVISDLPIFQNFKVINIPEQNKFLPKLFNEYLEEVYNSEEFIQSRYEFAKSGGKIFKEELGEKWNGSQWQLYINSLLKNLNEHSAFDLKSINNITIESFAAFCQKGEQDIDKLEDYLITNEIGDFRIAFSLWGIIFGFANMPKTLTNELFLSDDFDYVTNVYKHIFKQLHGVELDGKFEKTKTPKHPVQEITKVSLEPTIKKNNQTTKILPDNQDIRNKLKVCKLKPEQIDSISEIYEKNNSIINEKFVDSIQKIRGVGKKAIEKIKIALDYSEIKTTDPNQEELGTFSFPKPDLERDFYRDKNIWSYIEYLLPRESKIRKQVKTDLDWFQGNYMEVYIDKKKGETRGVYSDKPKENSHTINQFERYLKNKANGNQVWLCEIYKEVNIEVIISKLKELYITNGKYNKLN